MTILYESDWVNKHPQAIIDLKTKNQGFLKLAALYKKMGYSNMGQMILALHNRDLVGVDPYHPKDKDEERAIAIECKDNFWYFIREIARDPAGSEDDPIMFEPNRGVIAAYWLYLNHIVFFLIMIRQTGKSFGIDWLYTWLMNLGTTKYEIGQLTKDEKLRSRELARLKSMELTLPPYLRMRHPRDQANVEVYHVSRLNNYLRLYLPNKSEKLADMVGRGMSVQTVGADELAYLINNHITIPVMLSSTQAIREVAERKGEPYGTIFTTTTGKRDTPMGRYAYRLVHNSAVWTEAFTLAGNLNELIKMIMNATVPDENGERWCHVNCTFNHRQLGKDDAWLAARLKAAIQDDPVQTQADYFNGWPSGTLSTPFSKETAEAIRSSEVTDYHSQIDGDDCYVLRWYYLEQMIMGKMQNTPHILCVDSSDAVGRDAIGINLINIYTGEEAMAATISFTNLILFSRWLADFIEKNPRMTTIIERKGSGPTIIDYLLLYLPAKGINPFTRLYNTVVQDADEYKERFKEIQNPFRSSEDLFMKYKTSFGWATAGTGATSRSALYSKTLNQATRMGATLIRDTTLILQLLGLVIKNGRVDHQDGEHDDMVVSWLLGWWFMTSGKNLHHYGIEPRNILCENTVVMKEIEVQNVYEQYNMQRTKREIEDIKRRIDNTTDKFIIARLEYDLEKIIGTLCEEDRRIIAADDLLQTLKEKRQAVMSPGLNQSAINYMQKAVEQQELNYARMTQNNYQFNSVYF